MTLSQFDLNILNTIIKKNFPDEQHVFTVDELLFVFNEYKNHDKYIPQSRNTTPKYNIIKSFVKFLLYRSLSNFDSLVLVEGIKGAGKSSFAVLMAVMWCKMLDIKFDPNKHIAYTNAQVMHAIDTLPPFSPIICDEAVNFAVSTEWAKTENRELRRKLAQIRTKHFFFMLCFPMKISKVERTYLESFVNYWISIFFRGTGAMFIRDMNPAFDSWRIKDFDKIGSYNEFTPREVIMKKLQKHPNFWKMLNIPPLPEKVYERYLKVREKNVYNTEEAISTVTRETVLNALLVQILRDIMMKDGSVTMNRLAVHLRNEYDVDVKKSEIEKAFESNDLLVKKGIELGLVNKISEVEEKSTVRQLLKESVAKAA